MRIQSHQWQNLLQCDLGGALRWGATALLVILYLRPTFFVCASYGGNVDWRNDAIVRMRETG